MSSNKGFTLTELIVVMATFMILLIISASAFERIVSTASVTGKSVESHIEGIIGLEMLRRDINSAGFGLPWSFEDSSITYDEIVPGDDTPIKKIRSSDLNNAPSGVPQAFSHTIVPDTAGLPITGSSNDSIKGSDYLVVRSASTAFNNSAGKWSYARYSGSTATNSSYVVKSNGSDTLAAGEAVITLVDTFTKLSPVQRRLAMVSPTGFSYKIPIPMPTGALVPPSNKYKPSGNIAPGVDNEKVLVYALDSFTGSDAAYSIRMPFNRVDYFVRRPTTTMPSTCNPGTGILYKGVVINSTKPTGGSITSYPLMDCVGDLQVIFDLKADATSLTATSPSDTLAGMTAEDIRGRLKSVRVYILVHEGQRDAKYQYPYSDADNVIVVGDPRTPSAGRTFSAAQMLDFFGSNWRQYRWKVYTVVGQPYNFPS